MDDNSLLSQKTVLVNPSRKVRPLLWLGAIAGGLLLCSICFCSGVGVGWAIKPTEEKKANASGMAQNGADPLAWGNDSQRPSGQVIDTDLRTLAKEYAENMNVVAADLKYKGKRLRIHTKNFSVRGSGNAATIQSFTDSENWPYGEDANNGGGVPPYVNLNKIAMSLQISPADAASLPPEVKPALLNWDKTGHLTTPDMRKELIVEGTWQDRRIFQGDTTIYLADGKLISFK